MSLKSIIDMLRRHDLFAGLPSPRLEVIAFTAERMTFEAGELICEVGEEAIEALLILEGEAVMTQQGTAGQKIMTGDLVGEMALLSLEPQGAVRRADMRAVTRVEALSISRYLFQRLMQEFPEMAGAVAGALTRRLAQTSEEMSGLATRIGEMVPARPEKTKNDKAKNGMGA